ncbi:MAG: hypothetical protein HKN44_13320 [Ilumatobacter sp.]|nr:hypothetical protein [Ilumatobacter sp.]
MSDPLADPPDDDPPKRDSDPDGPRLPASVGSNPSIVVPPSHAEPAEPDTPVGPDSAHDLVTGHGRFSPLRSDPPPLLLTTWWLRYALFTTLFAALGSTVWTEYTGEAGDIGTSVVVIGSHVSAAVFLVAWSVLAMHNVETLVPARRYQSKSRGWLAAVLWMLAFAAPAGVALMYDRVGDRLADSEDRLAVVAFVPAVFTAFVLVWLPFRYCARHAARVGAPHRTVIAWFWVTLLALVGALAIDALGMQVLLEQDGLTAADRTIGVAVVYGLPMLVFALATARATTVFDEVVDLRWRRWKSEWEQTLRDLAAQPTPGPEASPTLPARES